jgi:hypothetical protein
MVAALSCAHESFRITDDALKLSRGLGKQSVNPCVNQLPDVVRLIGAGN